MADDEQGACASNEGNDTYRKIEEPAYFNRHDTPYADVLREKDKRMYAKVWALINAKIRPSQHDLKLACQTNLKCLFEMTNIVESHIKNMSRYIVAVQAAYQCSDKSEVVFIVFTNEPESVNVCREYRVLVVKIDDYSSEGATITYSKESLNKTITREESAKIKKALDKHSELIMDTHSNVQMISACSVKSKNFGTSHAKIIPKTCIVIYVDVKGLIPILEKVLPISLDDIPVDVREGGPRLLNRTRPDVYHHRLQMGCQIASCETGNVGTLGGFLENPFTNKLYCLTCAHVVVNADAFYRTRGDTLRFSDDSSRINQPDLDANNQIGHVERAVYKSGGGDIAGVEVALIPITNTAREPIDGGFPDGNFLDAGFTIQRPMMYTSGMTYTKETMPDQFERRSEVIKFGATTGPTRGTFYLDGNVVRRRNRKEPAFKLHNQIEILSIGAANTGPFAESGDSGALVFVPHNGNCSDLRAIGILEGDTSYNTFLVTPIWDILNALNMPHELKAFPYQDPEQMDM